MWLYSTQELIIPHEERLPFALPRTFRIDEYLMRR